MEMLAIDVVRGPQCVLSASSTNHSGEQYADLPWLLYMISTDLKVSDPDERRYTGDLIVLQGGKWPDHLPPVDDLVD